MQAELNFWSYKFLINLDVQAMEQKLWLYIRAWAAQISSHKDSLLSSFLFAKKFRTAALKLFRFM